MTGLLVIGDSISIGWTPPLRHELADRAEIVHNPGNGGDSSNLSAHLDDWLAEARPDLVLLNCGLHDLKRERGAAGHQVPLDRYRENLARIFRTLRAAGCPVVWITTTPVIDERHRARKPFDRREADVAEYNAAALAVADEFYAGVIDLHAAAVEFGPEAALGADGVHFTDDACQELGRFIAAELREHLK
ncbi:MAG: GDSL-type esterase/lipase family protein [Planctomycetota bacterium]